MRQSAAGRIGLAGWLRIALRVLALFGFLLVSLPLYGAAALLPGRNPIPRWFLGGVLRIVGGRLAITGRHVEAPSILLSNHVSWIDILALAKATGSVFVAHDGLASHPLMRFLCRLNRTVFIARNNRASVTGQVEQVRDGLRQNGMLTLFPEGTTGDGTQPLPFKSSLLAAIERSDDDVAIRPVWIDYGMATSDIVWVDQEPGLDNAKRILGSRRGFTVTIHLLAPLDAQQRQDRKTIAASARDAIVDAMDQRATMISG